VKSSFVDPATIGAPTEQHNDMLIEPNINMHDSRDGTEMTLLGLQQDMEPEIEVQVHHTRKRTDSKKDA
jgi:hypothetical protein